MTRKLLLLGMTACLCGCLHPTPYHRPTPPVPSAWPASAAGPAAAPNATEPMITAWRDFFIDKKLQSVIELALANNRDLRMAALNVERVQAMYRIQRAQQFPTVAAAANADYYRLPGSMASGGKPDIIGQVTVGLGATSWEADLFGRIRSLKSAALERYLASRETRNAAQIALVGAVADSYLALAADRENLRLAEVTLAAQQASYELILQTRNAGLASELELYEAQSQVEAARVDITRYSGSIALDENALNLLAGAPVPAPLLPGELGSDRDWKDIAAGLPSDVLLRRPDILMAEHQLKAAYANIDAARAAFFPRIALTAAAGLMSGDLTNLFKTGAGTWNFAPQISVPIFDSGTRKAALKIAQLDRDAAIAEYERAIQSAFRDVSDALNQRTNLREQQNAQDALVRALEETYRLSDARYKAGIDSYLSVLVAQRTLYRGQQVQVALRQARLSNLVNLYMVLGGGA